MTERAAGPTLRDPAHRVSPKAKLRWRIGVGITTLVAAGAIVALTIFTDVSYVWGLWVPWAIYAVVYLLVMPPLRYATHRWETTPTAIYTQTGWLGRKREIAPMSRVQTVEFRQGAIDRAMGLASVSVTTAAGDLDIDLLDATLAMELSQTLTAAAEAQPGDAT